MTAPNVSPGQPMKYQREMPSAKVSPARGQDGEAFSARRYTQQADFIADAEAHPGPGTHGLSPGSAYELTRVEATSTERSDSKRRTVGSVTMGGQLEKRDPRAPR